MLVALGLFTLTAGCERPPHCLVTAPLFERATVRHADGTALTIVADAGVARDGRVGSVTVDGAATAGRLVSDAAARGNTTIRAQDLSPGRVASD